MPKKNQFIQMGSSDEFEKILGNASTGEIVDLSARFVNLAKEEHGGGPGAFVMAKLITIERQELDNGSRNMYGMETYPDGEKIRLAGQTRLDQILTPEMIDKYLAIRFEGMGQTRKGHQLGEWTVREFTPKAG